MNFDCVKSIICILELSKTFETMATKNNWDTVSKINTQRFKNILGLPTVAELNSGGVNVYLSNTASCFLICCINCIT